MGAEAACTFIIPLPFGDCGPPAWVGTFFCEIPLLQIEGVSAAAAPCGWPRCSLYRPQGDLRCVGTAFDFSEGQPISMARADAARREARVQLQSRGQRPVGVRWVSCQGKIETSCFQQNENFRFGADGRSP